MHEEKEKHIQRINKATFDNTFLDLNHTSLKHGFNGFIKELQKYKPELTKNNLFYVNIWSIVCKPCLDEIPFIDNLPEKFNKNISCVMVSAHSNAAVNNFLKNNDIKTKNFIFMNEMIDFISGVYNEIEVKNQSFPLHVVIDRSGTCLAFLFGSIQDENSAAPLLKFINNLK